MIKPIKRITQMIKPIKHITHINATLSLDLPGVSPGESLLGTSGDPQKIKIDNNLRARWAAQAIKEFAASTGLLECEPETAVCDLLANTMHLCDCLDLDFDYSMSKAQIHYDCEIPGGGL